MYDFLLLANLMLWLGLTVYYAKQPCASAFHPVTYYLLFHFLVFVLRPFVAWYRHYDGIYIGYQFTPTMDDKITVLLATMLGLVSFVFAAVRAGGSAPRYHHDGFNTTECGLLIKPFLVIAALLVPLGLVSILANWDERANDASTMIRDAATGYSINTSGNGYFDNLQLFLAPITVMLVWLYRFRWWTFMPLLGFVVLRAGTGGRWPMVMACISVALLFLYDRRRRWPDLRALGIAAIGLALFALVGSDRGATIRQMFIDENSYAAAYGTGDEDARFMEGMDFANLEYFEYLVYAVPQRTGTYGYFLDNLQILTQPIPRVLWEGKPVGPPVQLFSLFDYGYPIGMTYSLPGNGWVQLGYLGVVIWCGLFGWVFGRIYDRFQRSPQGNPAILAYLLFLPLSLTFFRDGFLLTLIQTVMFFLLPVWLVHWSARLIAIPSAHDLRVAARGRNRRRAAGGGYRQNHRRRPAA